MSFLLFPSPLPSCCQPFLTWVKLGISGKAYWLKGTVSKVESNAREQKKKGGGEGGVGWSYFPRKAFKNYSLGIPGHCSNGCWIFIDKREIWSERATRLVTQLFVISAHGSGGIFAPVTSKLPLVYWLANRENWFLTNSPVLRPEHRSVPVSVLLLNHVSCLSHQFNLDAAKGRVVPGLTRSQEDIT